MSRLRGASTSARRSKLARVADGAQPFSKGQRVLVQFNGEEWPAEVTGTQLCGLPNVIYDTREQESGVSLSRVRPLVEEPDPTGPQSPAAPPSPEVFDLSPGEIEPDFEALFGEGTAGLEDDLLDLSQDSAVAMASMEGSSEPAEAEMATAPAVVSRWPDIVGHAAGSVAPSRALPVATSVVAKELKEHHGGERTEVEKKGEDGASPTQEMEAQAIAEETGKDGSEPTNYLEEFVHVLKAVVSSKSDLFSANERQLLKHLLEAPSRDQRLAARIHKRKDGWFRVPQLTHRYTEIEGVEEAVGSLLEASVFVALEGEDAAIHALGALCVADLKTVLSRSAFSCPLQPKDASKRGLVEAILQVLRPRTEPRQGGLDQWLQRDPTAPRKKQRVLAEIILEVTGHCIRLSPTAKQALRKLERCFYLNSPPEAFVLSRMGQFSFPEYRCAPSPIFHSEAQLTEYDTACVLAERFEMLVETRTPVTAILDEIMTPCLTALAKEGVWPSLGDACPACGATFPTESCRCLFDLEHAQGKALRESDAGRFEKRFRAAWVYAGVAWELVKLLEVAKRYEEAVWLLRCQLRGPWLPHKRGRLWERLTIDLQTNLHRHDEAIQAGKAAIEDPWLRKSERAGLARRLMKLCKARARPIPLGLARMQPKAATWRTQRLQGRPLNSRPGEKSYFYGYDDQLCSVEELALQWYGGMAGDGREEGWTGLHTEGRVWGTLFGLLLWEAIFVPVPHVFQTPFQTCPLDLDTEAFWHAREPILRSRLDQIRTAGEGVLRNMVSKAWESHHCQRCRGVHWEHCSVEKLEAIAECVGGKGLSHICHLLAQDYSHWHRGMPDLVLWRDDGSARLVEVKGPRDRLSDTQEEWLRELTDAGIDAEVLQVQEKPV